MVGVDLQFRKFKPMMLRYLLKKFSIPFWDTSLKTPLVIFRGPHEVILGVIHTVAGSLGGHATTPIGFLLPVAAHIFSSPPFQAGHSNTVFRKIGRRDFPCIVKDVCDVACVDIRIGPEIVKRATLSGDLLHQTSIPTTTQISLLCPIPMHSIHPNSKKPSAWSKRFLIGHNYIIVSSFI